MDAVRERKGIEKKFYELSIKIVENQGYKLYDLDYLTGNSELRLYIYNPETNTALIEDCVKVDKAFDPHLEEDWVPESLTLQVSSPGLFRSLKCLEHFKMAKGENVKMILSQSVEGLKDKKLMGKVIEIVDEKVKVEIDGNHYLIPISHVKKANLETEIERYS